MASPHQQLLCSSVGWIWPMGLLTDPAGWTCWHTPCTQHSRLVWDVGCSSTPPDPALYAGSRASLGQAALRAGLAGEDMHVCPLHHMYHTQCRLISGFTLHAVHEAGMECVLPAACGQNPVLHVALGGPRAQAVCSTLMDWLPVLAADWTSDLHAARRAWWVWHPLRRLYQALPFLGRNGT